MSLRDFFHGRGEIALKAGFVSTGLAKEILKRSFRIRILEESPNHIKCKIYRFARLIGFPVLFPNPTIDIAWESRAETSVINYRLTCYDYYVVVSLAFIFGISCSTLEHTPWQALRMGLFGAIFVLFFLGGLVFLDTKYLVHRIRKALLGLNCITTA